MRLHEINNPNLSLEQIVKLIKENCSYALDAMRSTNMFLFRGINGVRNEKPLFFKSESRLNRNPVASSVILQNNVNAAFDLAKFKANRSNSIFVTSNRNEAAWYSPGKKSIYLIFPLNGFNFTWSPIIVDLFSDIKSVLMFDSFSKNDYTNNPEILNKFLKQSYYTNNDFTDAITSGNEIMINGKYYAIHEHFYDHNLANMLFKSED